MARRRHGRYRSRMRPSSFLPLAALPLLAACASKPPANWAAGGLAVEPVAARWQRDGRVVDLLADGRVMIDGDHALTVDRAGRVFEPSGDAVALLEPDGALIGPDDRWMGQVGVRTASLRPRGYAWLSIAPNGAVTRFDEEGERHADGAWSPSCQGNASQTCMLVTHVIEWREEARRPRVGFGVGVGMGFHR